MLRDLNMSLSVLLFLALFWMCSSSSDTLRASQSFKDGDLLVSRGGKFAFGFFSPGDSGRCFVGIWYAALPVQTVVWVANRENTLGDTSGALSIDVRGDLVLLRQNGSALLWSTNVSSSLVASSSSPVIQLLDSGNLVLQMLRMRAILTPSTSHVGCHVGCR
ncbi:hypothetical protein MLD38_016785 [Melastoma candidum]|uniref:Uncharacterized protein n=1 Tax=Melastoma candidum TaxID=119954 RepID=A0ACB9QNI5_9MYRT|nr:hypothetical protein MLD38_016785 [Melastoma candidum]